MTSIGFSRKFDKDVSSVISEFLIKKHYKIKDCFSFENLSKNFPNRKININHLIEYLFVNTNSHSNIYIECIINKVLNNKIKIGKHIWRTIASSSYFPSSLEDYFILNFDNLDIIAKHKLACNPSAINVIKKHIEKIDMNSLCSNKHPEVVEILEQNLDKIDIGFLKYNEKAMSNTNICNYIISNYKNINEILSCHADIVVNEILQKILIDNDNFAFELDKENWENLCSNTHPSIIQLVEKNINTINSLENRVECWFNLCLNNSAINIIEKNLDMILSLEDIDRGECLCYLMSPSSIHIFDKNPDLLNHFDDETWECFCQNASNIQLIEKNLDKINWEYLCFNKHAMHLIEKNLDKLSLTIYENPNIFELDSKKYRNDINLMINQIYNL